jgi:peroxiredoxin
MRTWAGAEFDFLSDPEGKMIDLFDLRHTQGRADGVDIAQSASFLLSPEGQVLWFKVAENYRTRPDPSTVLAAADALIGASR